MRCVYSIYVYVYILETVSEELFIFPLRRRKRFAANVLHVYKNDLKNWVETEVGSLLWPRGGGSKSLSLLLQPGCLQKMHAKPEKRYVGHILRRSPSTSAQPWSTISH